MLQRMRERNTYGSVGNLTDETDSLCFCNSSSSLLTMVYLLFLGLIDSSSRNWRAAAAAAAAGCAVGESVTAAATLATSGTDDEEATETGCSAEDAGIPGDPASVRPWSCVELSFARAVIRS